MKLSPTEYVIQVFEGVRATAKAIGFDASNISKWRKYRHGLIPHAAQIAILKTAKERGLDITGEDLILGRSMHKDKT
ncbi:MAG: hypothetical protein H0X02_03405 [Nitrosomonas sp.]|nr:hypothetical protein [Nitrosomonas sp.]